MVGVEGKGPQAVSVNNELRRWEGEQWYLVHEARLRLRHKNFHPKRPAKSYSVSEEAWILGEKLILVYWCIYKLHFNPNRIRSLWQGYKIWVEECKGGVLSPVCFSVHETLPHYQLHSSMIHKGRWCIELADFKVRVWG